MFGNFRTKKFTDVWNEFDDFKDDYDSSALSGAISDESVETLYYLLYARYGNSTIANFDENQFKYKLFSIIFMYGPSWEERLSLQKKIRSLTDQDLVNGTKVIYNHANNPSTTPSTSDLTELNFINDQNTSNYKYSKIQGYQLKWELIRSDVTNEFLTKFKDLFLKIVEPYSPLYYETEVNENDY